MVTFPAGSSYTDVTLVPDQSKSLTALTVCLRFFSDETAAQGLFSHSTSNGFGLNSGCEMQLGQQRPLLFYGFRFILNQLHSVCATWNSKTGIAQLWVNGKPSTRKGLNQGGNISGTSINLGKYMYGSNTKYFTGMLTDVYMWDSVLSYSEILLYMIRIPPETKANIINWNSLNYTTSGYVIVEDIVDGLIP